VTQSHSQWGWCGSTPEHCSGPSPTPPTSTTLKGDWQLCSKSSECANGCCSGQYSGGTLKCTPLNGGYNSNICVGGSTNPPPAPTSPTSGLKGEWQLCSRSSECANGCCSGQYSGGTLKCTPLNGGYNSNICVGGSPTSPTQPSPTPPTSGGSRAYVTYHNYFAGEPLTDVACSDGRNGLMTRWGYSTIDPMVRKIMTAKHSNFLSVTETHLIYLTNSLFFRLPTWLRPPLVAGTVLIVENAIKLMVLQKLSTSLPLTSVHLVQRKYELVKV
jgi:hypothetical protein